MMERPIELVALSKDEIRSMMAEAALTGASAAVETFEKKRRKEDKEEKDRRLHNTKLLLKNYRMLKEHCIQSVFEKESAEESPSDIIENIMSMKGDKVIVDSIKRSAERTRILLDHIDKMLDIYRIYCGKYTDVEKRQYKVIKALYITKSKTTVKELAERFEVTEKTIYNDVKTAESQISALIFGINGMHFFQ